MVKQNSCRQVFDDDEDAIKKIKYLRYIIALGLGTKDLLCIVLDLHSCVLSLYYECSVCCKQPCSSFL